MALRRSERIFKRNHRRIPNEISSIIIENLADNFTALRNLALVCKDFAALAQSHIFREIDLAINPSKETAFRSYPRVRRLASLLESSEIHQFVQRLKLSSDGISLDELGVMAHILHLLTSLTSLTMRRPESRLFVEIETSSLGGTLKWLRVDSSIRCNWNLASFQRMLMSLSCLEVLAMCGSPEFLEPGAFLLPSSLRMASFTVIRANLLCAIGRGLKIVPLPFLRTLVLDPLFADQDQGGHVDWNGLRTGTRVFYKLHINRFPYTIGDYQTTRVFPFIFATRGIEVQKLMFICDQSPWLSLFARCVSYMIPHLPSSVSELCIDATATVQYSLQKQDPQDWPKLDDALVKRHEQGLMKRVCFRCTKLEDDGSPEHFVFSHPFGKIDRDWVGDRTILDEIEGSLPRSKSLGFLEVDRDTVFFEPTM
ncbi:hypothetical protein GYMLUDRAFT_245172 [Collybiopsis luxurians FD-317 M1]|uniref:F-box domain-containing protein n=1 Tax=Collybiopsis luxurians FD-317 M1 TaxID=944289 RepID=A0A0D0BVE6_9AGAR|nr:hypothetical protein GYMLUDRAFT_245172 [Collybiopsis luxurians FD-317 M1]